jgi:hypothetical protein
MANFKTERPSYWFLAETPTAYLLITGPKRQYLANLLDYKQCNSSQFSLAENCPPSGFHNKNVSGASSVSIFRQ